MNPEILKEAPEYVDQPEQPVSTFSPQTPFTSYRKNLGVSARATLKAYRACVEGLVGGFLTSSSKD